MLLCLKKQKKEKLNLLPFRTEEIVGRSIFCYKEKKSTCDAFGFYFKDITNVEMFFHQRASIYYSVINNLERLKTWDKLPADIKYMRAWTPNMIERKNKAKYCGYETYSFKDEDFTYTTSDFEINLYIYVIRSSKRLVLEDYEYVIEPNYDDIKKYPRRIEIIDRSILELKQDETINTELPKLMCEFYETKEKK